MPVCGHINKQYYPTVKDGEYPKQVDLVCDLPKGHDGDHAANYPTPVASNSGALMERAYWNNGAEREIRHA